VEWGKILTQGTPKVFPNGIILIKPPGPQEETREDLPGPMVKG